MISSRAVALPAGAVEGLALSYTSATSVSISAGECRDSTDVDDILVPSTLTPSLTTSGAGGLDTGAEANATFYHVYVIKNPSSGAVSSLLSTSSTSPTLPSGYTRFRRVGCFQNGGNGDIVPFMCVGVQRTRTYEVWATQSFFMALSGGSATAYTDVSLSNTAPSTAKAFLLTVSPTSANAYVRPNGVSFDSRLIKAGAQLRIWMPNDGTNTIEYKNAAGGGSTDISVDGYSEHL